MARSLADSRVTKVQQVSPEGEISYVAGTGTVKTITGSDPAAGGEVLVTVPASKVWRLLSIDVELLTSANVATRIVDWAVDDGDATHKRAMFLGYQTGQEASLSKDHVLQKANQVDAAITDTKDYLIASTLKDIGILLPGYRIRTVTTLLDAGDNFNTPFVQVEEFTE